MFFTQQNITFIRELFKDERNRFFCPEIFYIYVHSNEQDEGIDKKNIAYVRKKNPINWILSYKLYEVIEKLSKIQRIQRIF